MSRFIKLLIIIFLLFNLFFVAFLLYPADRLFNQFKLTETIKIVDRHEELLYEVLNDKGRQTFLSLSDIPESLQNAFVAVEDRRFYEHSGVDFQSILRAIWQNLSAGEVISGGSTITQQLVRNIIGINKERTFFQKIKESLFALKVSRFTNKNTVFEMYLNSIYFGGLAYGIEAASFQYFDKSAAYLDLAESAFLAGLPQAPNRYNPYRHFEVAKERQEAVLRAMLASQFITKETFDQALSESLNLRSSSFNKRAPHFVDYVISNGGSDWVADGGLIRTTLDLGLQERIDNLVYSDLTFLDHYNINNAAVVIMDAQTGEILVMLGGKDYSDESIQGQVNVATSLRQPGSSIKPLFYAMALEKGWNTNTIIVDEPVYFETADGFPYSPKNFDLQYHGEVTLAEALAQSLNIPAVKTLEFVSLESFLSMAEQFGITTLTQSSDYYGLALALGSGEVQLLELVNAYATFANHGKRPLIRSIKFEKNSKSQNSNINVISPKTAQSISAILSNNELRMPAFGEENPLKFSFPVAAKTGTTRNFRDNWTIGYTDDYVVGVWVGNTSGDVMEGVSGISGAGPIFHKIMNLLNEASGTKLTVDPTINILESRQMFADSQDYNFVSDSSVGRQDFRIISPFANDLFLFDPRKPAEFQKIQLTASQNAEWFVDGQLVGEGKEVLWLLEKGIHQIRANYEIEERMVEIEVK